MHKGLKRRQGGMAAKKIAILGSTSHIAKGLIYNISKNDRYDATLFARNIKAARPLEEFNKGKYEVVINCIGSTSEITEKYDALTLDYLKVNPSALCINFSSGVVYIESESPYKTAKIQSEVKHREHPDLNIIDLRLFAYFSRFIDLESEYFITEIIRCVKNKSDFVTGPDDMTRDYVHPQDLFLLVEKCIEKHRINDVYDVYSLKPATKYEILDYFKKVYGLRVVIKDDILISSPTGDKLNYYSENKKAQDLGYYPKFTSLDCISEESCYFLSSHGNGCNLRKMS